MIFNFWAVSIRSNILSFFEMPFYAVIFKTLKAGSVASNWDVARGLRDGTPNSFAKKFESRIEAEKYIRDLNYKIVNNKEPISVTSGLGLKRKRLENSNNSFSIVNEHIKKIKTSFDDLHTVLSSFPALPSNCAEEIKILNDDVISRLSKIFNKTIYKDNFSLEISSSHSLNCTGQNNKSITSITDETDSKPSGLKEESKKSFTFTFNDKNEVVVYTDGACSNNGYNGASAGAGIWFGNGHPLNLAVKVPGTQTNNNAEIFSTIKAIDLVKANGFSKINIHTDSDFVIKSINEWLPRWLSNGWKTSSGSEVKNKEMFMILHQKIKSMDSVSWTHVPGHKGVIGNEEADKLARLGAKM